MTTEDKAIEKMAEEIVAKEGFERLRLTSDKELDEMVEVLRLMLVAQLAELSGLVWMVRVERNRWDVKFDCRYGLGKYQILSIDFGLEKYKEHLEDRMKNVAWDLINAKENRSQ